MWIMSPASKDFTGEVTWRRYASGLSHALGLRIVNDTVHVLGRDQITRLHDLNGEDGTPVPARILNTIHVVK